MAKFEGNSKLEIRNPKTRWGRGAALHLGVPVLAAGFCFGFQISDLGLWHSWRR
jgi:hypothetical protein